MGLDRSIEVPPSGVGLPGSQQNPSPPKVPLPEQSIRTHSSQGLVEVLGTSFNVKDRDNIFSVSCFTGKVRVTSGSDVVILSAGEGVSLDDGSLVKLEEQVEPEKTWMQGYFPVWKTVIWFPIKDEILTRGYPEPCSEP